MDYLIKKGHKMLMIGVVNASAPNILLREGRGETSAIQ
jgi:hypothetical protein